MRTLLRRARHAALAAARRDRFPRSKTRNVERKSFASDRAIGKDAALLDQLVVVQVAQMNERVLALRAAILAQREEPAIAPHKSGSSESAAVVADLADHKADSCRCRPQDVGGHVALVEEDGLGPRKDGRPTGNFPEEVSRPVVVLEHRQLPGEERLVSARAEVVRDDAHNVECHHFGRQEAAQVAEYDVRIAEGPVAVSVQMALKDETDHGLEVLDDARRHRRAHVELPAKSANPAFCAADAAQYETNVGMRIVSPMPLVQTITIASLACCGSAACAGKLLRAHTAAAPVRGGTKVEPLARKRSMLPFLHSSKGLLASRRRPMRPRLRVVALAS
eukprot:4896787-Prymnesium_polylepis.1